MATPIPATIGRQPVRRFRAMDLSCSCGKRFRSMIAEARHRHNFPTMCRKPKPKRGEHHWFQKIHYSEAEKMAGQRLDRRKTYYKHTEEGLKVDNPYAFNGTDGTPKAIILTYSEWSDDCSGCTEAGEYGGRKYGPFGCSECGYTGKRRTGFHAPHDLDGGRE